MESMIVIFSILSILISIPALVVSLYTLIELKAMKKSTHRIEYMPIPVPEVDAKVDKEFKESLNEDFTSSFIV